MDMYSLLGLLVLILDIVAIVSVLVGTSTALRKVFWILIILLLPVLGMILYFLLGRSVQDA